jgi:hypothetical protein
VAASAGQHATHAGCGGNEQRAADDEVGDLDPAEVAVAEPAERVLVRSKPARLHACASSTMANRGPATAPPASVLRAALLILKRWMVGRTNLVSRDLPTAGIGTG